MSSSSGIGFGGLLTIILIVLKVMGYITISWWWIVFVIPIIIFLKLVVLAGIIGLVVWIVNKL